MRRHILVLEDNVVLSKAIRRHLEQEGRDGGVDVTVVTSCQEARWVIEAGQCDLIVSDFQLGDGVGLDWIEELSLAGKRPPVILVTGDERHAWEERALDLGIEACLVKPIAMLTLSRVVGCLMEDHCCFPSCSKNYEAHRAPEHCPLNLEP